MPMEKKSAEQISGVKLLSEMSKVSGSSLADDYDENTKQDLPLRVVPEEIIYNDIILPSK